MSQRAGNRGQAKCPIATLPVSARRLTIEETYELSGKPRHLPADLGGVLAQQYLGGTAGGSICVADREQIADLGEARTESYAAPK
jgi:hypothetical protein